MVSSPWFNPELLDLILYFIHYSTQIMLPKMDLDQVFLLTVVVESGVQKKANTKSTIYTPHNTCRGELSLWHCPRPGTCSGEKQPQLTRSSEVFWSRANWRRQFGRASEPDNFTVNKLVCGDLHMYLNLTTLRASFFLLEAITISSLHS